VVLEGVRLGTTAWGDYNIADTLIQRSADPFDRCEPASPQSRTIDIELVALSLRSIQPIVVTYNGGQNPEQWDVEVDLSTVPSAPGLAVVTKTHDNGGVFDAILPVQPRFKFTRLGYSTERVKDNGLDGIAPFQFEFLDCSWVHTPCPGLFITPPPTGHMVPAVFEPVPGDLCSQYVNPLWGNDVLGAGCLLLAPPQDETVSVVDLPGFAKVLRVIPNPFNPTTKISFDLRQPGPVRLRIYDLKGALVRTLIDTDMSAGFHESSWQATNDHGQRVASGVYLAILEANGEHQTTKMAVVK